jgi:hypothetical protein
VSLISVSSLEEFFKTEIDDLFKSSIEEETKFYLVSLLSRFGKSSNFFGIKDGKMENLSTVSLLLEAQEEKELDPKRLIYRQVGDICLYSSGFLSKRSGYYSYFGKRSYSSVLELSEKNQKDLYRCLSCDFDFIADKIKKIPRIQR